MCLSYRMCALDSTCIDVLNCYTEQLDLSEKVPLNHLTALLIPLFNTIILFCPMTPPTNSSLFLHSHASPYKQKCPIFIPVFVIFMIILSTWIKLQFEHNLMHMNATKPEITGSVGKGHRHNLPVPSH